MSGKHEKSPLESKKFIAYLLAEATWKLVLIITLWSGKDVLMVRTDLEGGGVGMWWFMFTVVIVAGFIEAGFIGGQTWLDKYVRVASIVQGARPGASTESTPPE
jgi:hypothetical protein